MEKEIKEWGNKEQRAMLNTLRVMFPQVDVRILKGTVLEGNDIDAAVEFILMEVLEQPSTGKVDERLVKELISGSFGTAELRQSPGDKRASSAKNHYAQDQNPFMAGIMGDMFNVGGTSAESVTSYANRKPLIDLDDLEVGSDKAAEGSKLPVQESSPIDIPVGVARVNVQESLSYENPLKSPYIVMSESLTESEPDTLVRYQDSGRTWMDAGKTVTESASVDNKPVQPPVETGARDESAYLAESLYGSVLDVTTEADYTGGDAGGHKLEDLWSDEEKTLEKHISSKGSRWAYDSDEDYSDMQGSKSSLLAAPSGQFDGMSRYSDEGSRLMESSVLEETYDGLFNSGADSMMNSSSQILGVDALDELVNGAKSDKDALVAAIEEMRVIRSKVEEAEAAAQQAKKAALTGGLDVLEKVEEMRAMLVRAREANEMHAGEVYGEKAVLGTESQELQRRLAQLKAEKEKAFKSVAEMRATLQARIDLANEEREAAEAEKCLKEENARSLLAVEVELMAKVAQESRDLGAEEEACTKLRDFLIERGSIVDSLQGEVAIICEDVEVVKKQLAEGILSGGSSSFLQMLGNSRSLSNSVNAGNSQFGALSQSGSSYQSATRAGESESNTEELVNSELVDDISRLSLTLSGEEPQKTNNSSTDSGDDEGWQLLETSSTKSNNSPASSSPSPVKRIRSQ